MPKSTRTIRLERLEGQLGDVAYELTKVEFSNFHATGRWRPPINAYRCEKCLRICVDLAGVDRDEILLEIEPGLLTISGRRALPEPLESQHPATQVLAMEIDHGEFKREIPLPRNVDRKRVHAEQQNGMLWIYLPLQHH